MGKRRAAGSLLSCLLAAGVLLTACSTGKNAPIAAHGSARQVYALGLPPREKASLLDKGGKVVQQGRVGALGGLLFAGVRPGNGYRVRLGDGQESGSLTVHSNAAKPWDPAIYRQKIRDNGYSYLTTRDGTKLAIDVHLPTRVHIRPPTSKEEPESPSGTEPANQAETGPPFPTVIEYSGYGYADPAGPINGIGPLANLMGIAVVDVNMRGTGCSGGAFNFFEPLQDLDAYDIIETIAHQPWVLDHKVGMIGLSYGSISQLFAAQLDPPDLEAISPLSTVDAMGTTLYPGGILNTGFAVHWAEQRQYGAQPAGPNAGQAWAYKRIRQGDATCKANQALHGAISGLMSDIRANAYYDPALSDPLDPVSFVHKIDVPVFMACQWEDEQTGGHCPELVQHFTGTDKKWFFFTNGNHIDSLDPYVYDRWYDFLQLFVAHEPPIENVSLSRSAAPFIYKSAFGLPQSDFVRLPPDPIQSIPTYKGALAAFEKIPQVTVLFDNGAGRSPSGTSTPGDPYATFVRHFESLPVPGTTARRWYLGPTGSLTATRPVSAVINRYTSDARALPATDYGPDNNWGSLWANAPLWEWAWKDNPAGTAVSYVSAPLASDTTVIGAGAVTLWVRSSRPKVDFQATVSEVRPDGKETFVQNGWLRGTDRVLSTGTDNMFKQKSTVLDPIPTFRQADARPLPADHFTKLVIPLYFEGHAYRAGSRIRLTIAAPGGSQPVWSFGETEPFNKTAEVFVASSPREPSSLVLPVVPGVSIPTPLPACSSLRNEPCRPYRPTANR